MKTDANQRRKRIRIAGVIAGLFVLAFAALFLLLRYQLGKTNYVGEKDVLMTEILETESEAPPTAEEMVNTARLASAS